MPAGLFRTLLFMPAHKARLHEKAKTLDTDAIILDLEDAVGEKDKAAARQQLTSSLQRLSPFPCSVLVRINHPQSHHCKEDAHAIYPLISASLINGVVIPKVESEEDIKKAAAALPEGTPLWANIETPLAVLNLSEIAESSPSLTGLIAGINDLSAALRLPQGERWEPRLGLQYALSHIVLAGRAYGKQVIDGVYNRIADLEGLERECHEGRQLGFDGKSLIHPTHLGITNRVFSPTEAERRAAESLLQAYAESSGGAIRHEGQMVEELHLERARRIMAFFNQQQ